MVQLLFYMKGEITYWIVYSGEETWMDRERNRFDIN